MKALYWLLFAVPPLVALGVVSVALFRPGARLEVDWSDWSLWLFAFTAVVIFTTGLAKYRSTGSTAWLWSASFAVALAIGLVLLMVK